MAAGDGLVSMTPTSIAYSGTSATINADGGVDFTAVTELNLNGVFTSDYDNYLFVTRLTGTGAQALGIKLRVSGTDTTDSNYARQYLQASGASTLAGRQTGVSLINLLPFNTFTTGQHLHIYGPALAQATAGRVVNTLSGDLADYAWTHSTATAYDGLSLFVTGGSVTGNIHVFGYEE
jgi:hypothetical protein